MLKLKKKGTGFILSFVLLALLLPGGALASDLDIIGNDSSNVPPNILIIMDISGSMAGRDVLMGGGYVTRLKAAQDVIIGIIEANPGMKWGLMTFPWPRSSPYTAGHMVAECHLREVGSTDWNNFISAIRGLTPSGNTPMASALAEAGLYFAGKNSFFHDNTGTGNSPGNIGSGVSYINVKPYNSPIENVCQKNFIIMLTDGRNNLDAGVYGGYTSYTSTDRFNMASKNSIFLRDYMDGRRIGNYITDNGLGDLISDSDFIFTLNWNLGAIAYSSSGAAVNPALTDFYYTQAQIAAMTGTPYTYGYNAADPSRPIPYMPVVQTGSGASLRTTVYLNRQGYIKDTQIAQGILYDDGYLCSDYADDTTAFLYNEDIRLDMDDAPTGRYDKQFVKTYTIGFMVSTDLLLRMAVQGGTGKEGYMTATDAHELEDAFSTIVGGIVQELNMMAMPSLPTASGSETNTGDKVYFGFFKPTDTGWLGNLKRYTLEPDHTLGSNADAAGFILDTAESDWNTGAADGNKIEMGGAKAALARQMGVSSFNRNVYTWLGGSSDLTDGSNAFAVSNRANLSGVIDSSGYADLDRCIEHVRGLAFGPVIHSSPVVAEYGGSEGSVVYIGTNEGFLHALDDDDGSEKWVFIMPEHLDDIHNAGNIWPVHGQWFVDGTVASKVIATGGGETRYLIFGARRGGETYVLLDVSNSNRPLFGREITPGYMGSPMGQSWAIPKFTGIHSNLDFGAYDTSSDPCVEKQAITLRAGDGRRNIIVLAGGYDERYDSLDPLSVAPAKGAGITAVDLSAVGYGSVDVFDDLNAGANPSIMKHSILDLAAADMNGDLRIDSLYFGDLGGYLFNAVFYNIVQNGTCGSGEPKMRLTATSKFQPYRIFQASEKLSGEAEGSQHRKIMYAPDIVRESKMDYIYFGTGDRESPLDELVQNRFYCIKNNDYSRYENGTGSGYLKHNDLVDITDDLITGGTDAEKAATQADLDSKNGWYLDLQTGEKVVSTPIAYDGMVFFTTYTPDLGSAAVDPTDVCVSGATGGTARIYALKYLTGAGAQLTDYGDQNGRAQIIGDTIPSGVILSVFEDGQVYVFAGTMSDGQPGLSATPLGPVSNPSMFYWRQVY